MLRLRISIRALADDETDDAEVAIRFTGDNADLAASAAALWASDHLLALLSEAPAVTARPSLS